MEPTQPPAADSSGDLATRLAEVEARLGKVERKRRDAWDKAQAITSMATPLLTFGLGLWLVNLANVGLERQRLRVTSVKEMQSLITEIRDPASPPEKLETAATALAAFGPAAITPLLNVVQTGRPNLVIAGEGGLRAVGMTDPELACARLVDVVRNRSPLYAWQTQRSAIRLLGDLSCPGAHGVLEEYGAHLGRSASDAGFARFLDTVAANPAPTRESVDLLAAEVRRGLEVLARAKGEQ